MRRPLLLLTIPFLLPAGAAVAQSSPSASRHTSARDDSMRSFTARGFQLYAPTDGELRVMHQELQLAIGQFQRYIGQAPPKLAIVQLHSAEQVNRYDFSTVTKGGMAVLPWVAPPSPPARRAPGAGDRRPGAQSRDNPHPLSHEAAHMFFNGYVELAFAQLRAKGERSAADKSKAASAGPSDAAIAATGGHRHHGHPLMPDWYEEAVATLCEPPTLQEGRIEFMRAHPVRRIPFAELLTMDHPAPGAGDEAAERAAIFSAEALAVIRFIAQREGDRFVGKIAEGLVLGRTVGEVLSTSKTLFSKPEELEKQWLEWMKKPSQAP